MEKMNSKYIFYGFLFSQLINTSCNTGKDSGGDKSAPTKFKVETGCCSYKYFSLKVDDTWRENISSDTLVVFVKANDVSGEYKANFSGMLLKEGITSDIVNLDVIMQENIVNLKGVYEKIKIVEYDTVSVDNAEGRMVSFVARTDIDQDVGSVIYLYLKWKNLYLFSFQGPNENGGFKTLYPEVLKINSTIKLKK